jgi:hypothetical protein
MRGIQQTRNPSDSYLPGMEKRKSVGPAVLLAAVLLTGCGGEDNADASEATAARTTFAPAASSPTTAPIETSSAAPDGGAAPGASPDASADPVVGPPREVLPEHGERVWAVYLAVGSPDSERDMHELGEAESYLRGMYGYTGSGIGSVGCDQGAAEALGFDPAHNRVAVYFDSAAGAQEFVAVYDRQDVGSAEVTTYCLD